LKLFVILACAASAMAQANRPFLFYGSATHAATYAPPGVPSGAIPRGGLFTVFGRNLGPTAGVSANAFPIPSSLGGTRIEVLRGTQTFEAIPVFVSAAQINAILPSAVPAGRAALRVTVNNAQTNVIPIDVAQANFGIFSVNSGGFGPAIVTNFIEQINQPLNSLQQAAQPGQVVTIWGSGLGPVPFPDNTAPTAGNVGTGVVVYVGGVPAEILYAGRAPCCAALDQIVIRLPLNVPQGCWVPIQVVAGGLTSNTATLAIHSTPTGCVDPHSPFSSVIKNGGRLARVLTVRASRYIDVATPELLDLTFDHGVAQLASYDANPFAWQLVDSMPPVNTCAAHTVRGPLASPFALLPLLRSKPVEPPATIILRGALTQALRRITSLPNVWYEFLGANLDNRQLFFPVSSTVSFSASGTAEIPALILNLPTDNRGVWTNRDVTANVRRNAPFTLTWTPRPGGLVIATASNFAQSKNAGAFIACVADSSTGRITIPPHLLGTLPTTERFVSFATGDLALRFIPNLNGTPLSIPGFDAAIAHHVQSTARSVTFQ
jgi:uncharacterized protein (TIGR03437 family)